MNSENQTHVIDPKFSDAVAETVDAKIAELSTVSVVVPSETPQEDKPTKDYVTYTMTAQELLTLSVFEAGEFASARKESLYVRLHRVIGEVERGQFELGGIVASNGAIDPKEPVTIVYRRPLKFGEKASDFEEGKVKDGKVELTLQVDIEKPLGNRLQLVASVYAPLYAALASQYSIAHIYYLADRLSSGVVVGDPSTYIVFDQDLVHGNKHNTEEGLSVYRLVYVGQSQTNDAITRMPAIQVQHVIESDHTTNFGEIFPVIRCGNRVAVNGFLEFDCVFTESAFYRDAEHGDNEHLSDYEVPFEDSLIFINKPSAYQHVDRKLGRLLD